MAATHSYTAGAMEREVVITRMFDAPRELVFQAWTEAKHMQNWWGPKYFTNPVCEMDVRVGGKWRIVMRGPGGAEYPCEGEYREIVAPERLVFTNNAVDAEGKRLLDGFTSVLFEEVAGNKTKLTLTTKAIGRVDSAPQMLAGMQMGWSQSLAKLEEMIAPASKVKREIVTTRTFDAPREVVFDAWTLPEHVAKWYGPTGFTLTTHQMDVKPGGQWNFIMHGPDGTDYDTKVVYMEVARPERLVYAHVVEPYFESTVTFEAEGGKTKLTMTGVFLSAEELEHAVKVYHADEGGRQTLARLAEFVSSLGPTA
jgi:uncharacterized protein YndB with AHSA1/START domain